MKRIIIFSIALGLLSACNKDEANLNTELIGNWKLIEVLVDPGDGSGSFNSVVSDKIITFNDNGTINSNGSLCDMSIDVNNPTNGTYSISGQTFSSLDCINSDYNFKFEQNGNILIIYYPCFEPCKAKYEKQ